MDRALEGYAPEKESSFLYGVLAEVERGTPREELFRKLADAAEEQAEVWATHLSRIPEVSPSLRARLVARLVRRFGVPALRPALAAMKVRGLSAYDHGHEKPSEVVGSEKRHAMVGGGNLRAAVFGVNDGLVSNTALILGVAGANAGNHVILLSGVAGLLAGAFSMAAGEYVSVRSQRELYEYQIGLEREELAEYPEEEAEELALIYAARGLPKDDARELAQRITADPARALDTLAREELGLDPSSLGSPLGAAQSSFAAFAIGAALPLMPFALASGWVALGAAVALAALALFSVGAALSLFTGRSALYGGARMLAIGSAAGAATFAIGRLLG